MQPAPQGVRMILIGLGANLPSPEFGAPENTLEAALRFLAGKGVTVRRRSNWYVSPPIPPSDQPWYVNGVASVETELTPAALLDVLQDTERRLGRTRRTRWEARVADLDLLAYGDQIISGGQGEGAHDSDLTVPHPRLHERHFVLVPLAELDGGWRHPIIGKNTIEMLANLPKGYKIKPLG